MPDDEPAEPLRCVTHDRPVEDCREAFETRVLLTALERSQCSDVNGPGWVPPTLPWAFPCPACGRPRPITEARGLVVRLALCPCTPITIEIVKVKETTS